MGGEPADPDYWPPADRDLVLTVDDLLVEEGRIAPFSPVGTSYAAMRRFGNVFLTSGEPDLRLAARAGEVVRWWLTDTANTRVFNLTIPGARMKLVGGDSGRVEHEEFIESVVLAPSERAVVDVLAERPGELHLEHHTPDRSYRLATLTVAGDRAAPSVAARACEVLRLAPELAAEREGLDRWLAAPPDKVLALVAQMDDPAALPAGAGPVTYTLAAGSILAAIAFIGDDSGIEKAAGWVFVISAVLAWYTASAMMLAATAKRVILPLGKYQRDANIPRHAVTRPISTGGQNLASEWGNRRQDSGPPAGTPSGGRPRSMAPHGEEDGNDRRRRRRFLRIGLQVVALGVAAFFFFRQRHVFEGFLSAIGRIRWPLVAAAVAAEIASIPPLAQAQRMLLRAKGLEAGLWRVIQVTLASNAISMSLPAGVAVAEGYAYTKYRWLGAKEDVAAWAELAGGAIAFSALAGLALAGALIAGGPGQNILISVLGVVWAGSLAAAEAFRHPGLLVRAVQWLERHVGRRLGTVVARASRRVREITEGLAGLEPSLGSWAVVGGLSALNWLLDTACLMLSFVAVGTSLPWGVTLLTFAGTKIVSSSGITPGGIGLVEGGMVATLVAYGIKGSAAVVGVLVYRAITYVGLVGVGWLAAAALAARTHVEDASQ